MAEILGTSASGIEAAIKKIDDKKNELEVQANNISNAFTDATTTVQLAWFNEIIRDGWNGQGNGLVENAKATMTDLMNKLDEIKTTAESISNV